MSVPVGPRGVTRARGRAHLRAHVRGPLLGLAVLAVVLVLCALLAAPAQAVSVNPLTWPGAAIGAVSGGIGGLAVGAFDAIIHELFSPISRFVTTELIGWLVAVPNFTHGHVARLETTVVAMGGGLLGAVATISTLRYWAAGFAGGGDSAFAALEGLARTVAAALFLAIWPWLFDSAVSLTNLFTQGLLGSGSVVNDTAKLLAAGLAAGVALPGGLGLFVGIVIAAGASLLFLGLLLLKIVVSVSTILVFVGMPMAVVLWPLAAVGGARGDARLPGVPGRAGAVGAVLRRVGGGEPRRARLSRWGRAV